MSIKLKNIALSCILVLMVFAFVGCSHSEGESSDGEDASSVASPSESYGRTSQYLADTLLSAESPVLGNDWVTIGYVQGQCDLVPGYPEAYYQSFAQNLASENGVLDATKYTEYSRSVYLLHFLGKDPQNVNGYNLLMPLADFQAVSAQGINGTIWGLIAISCGNYQIPERSDVDVQATVDLYLQTILYAQADDGSFSLDGSTGDVDITAMALQALSYYKDQETINAAIERGIQYLSSKQKEDGTVCSADESSAESCAQVLLAMSALGMELDDSRLVTNGKTVYDGMMTFALDNGSFCHILSEPEANSLATSQCYLALSFLQ